MSATQTERVATLEAEVSELSDRIAELRGLLSQVAVLVPIDDPAHGARLLALINQGQPVPAPDEG